MMTSPSKGVTFGPIRCNYEGRGRGTVGAVWVISSQSSVVLSWVGNLGRVIGENAEYSRGVPEPCYFIKTDTERSAMVLTAEAYVAGVTDSQAADLAAITAEVRTDLGSTFGTIRPLRLNRMTDSRRTNNNVRITWDIAPLVARAAPGRYHFQFCFSVDEGKTFTKYPSEMRHLIVAADAQEVPTEAAVESSVLFKVGEVTSSRIGWLGPATVRVRRDQPPQSLPVEISSTDCLDGDEKLFIELALQVWAPGVSNRVDLTPDEHSLVLKQLGLRIESPFFIGSGSESLCFAGKAGIHEHDDIARLNLAHYLDELITRKVPLPAPGDYAFEVYAGEKKLGCLLLHWKPVSGY